MSSWNHYDKLVLSNIQSLCSSTSTISARICGKDLLLPPSFYIRLLHFVVSSCFLLRRPALKLVLRVRELGGPKLYGRFIGFVCIARVTMKFQVLVNFHDIR